VAIVNSPLAQPANRDRKSAETAALRAARYMLHRPPKV
jgi:hypothetical protein